MTHTKSTKNTVNTSTAKSPKNTKAPKSTKKGNIMETLQFNEKAPIKKHQIEKALKNLNTMISGNMKDKREVITHDISVTLLKGSKVQIMQNNNTIETSLNKFHTFLNDELKALEKVKDDEETKVQKEFIVYDHNKHKIVKVYKTLKGCENFIAKSTNKELIVINSKDEINTNEVKSTFKDIDTLETERKKINGTLKEKYTFVLPYLFNYIREEKERNIIFKNMGKKEKYAYIQKTLGVKNTAINNACIVLSENNLNIDNKITKSNLSDIVNLVLKSKVIEKATINGLSNDQLTKVFKDYKEAQKALKEKALKAYKLQNNL